MKKRFIATFTAILLCLAASSALTGCSLVKGFERDVQVVLEVDGEYYASYTVNIFNNAVVTAPEVPARFEGRTFVGWTGRQDWEEMKGKDVPISSNKGLIRYDDVKDYIAGKSRSVTLQAAFLEIDLVIAWYDRGDTSGLNQSYIDAFEKKMNEYLIGQGYDLNDMFIVLRSYDSTVLASCTKIKADGDVDIMLGWNGSIATTGQMAQGVDYIETVVAPIGYTANRHAARVTDTPLCNLVFAWIVGEYGA